MENGALAKGGYRTIFDFSLTHEGINYGQLQIVCSNTYDELIDTLATETDTPFLCTLQMVVTCQTLVGGVQYSVEETCAFAAKRIQESFNVAGSRVNIDHDARRVTLSNPEWPGNPAPRSLLIACRAFLAEYMREFGNEVRAICQPEK